MYSNNYQEILQTDNEINEEQDTYPAAMETVSHIPTHVNRRPTTSLSLRNAVVNLYKSNVPISAIATNLEIKRSTVYNIIKRFNETGSIEHFSKGGDKRSMLSEDSKNKIKEWLNENCLLTLKEICDKLRTELNVVVSISTVNRAICEFHYSLKQLSVAPERRNTPDALEIRLRYSESFRTIEDGVGSENFVFIDEVGFKIETRPSRGRALINTPAYYEVPQIRSKNFSVVAAMTKNTMLFSKIHTRPINSEMFQECLNEIKDKCLQLNLMSPVLVMDNVRVHHARNLNYEGFRVLYLPAYSPFLNPIENAFSKWKNFVNRNRSECREELIAAIKNGFLKITAEDCNGYWLNMRKYLRRAQDCEIITD